MKKTLQSHSNGAISSFYPRVSRCLRVIAQKYLPTAKPSLNTRQGLAAFKTALEDLLCHLSLGPGPHSTVRPEVSGTSMELDTYSPISGHRDHNRPGAHFSFRQHSGLCPGARGKETWQVHQGCHTLGHHMTSQTLLEAKGQYLSLDF